MIPNKYNNNKAIMFEKWTEAKVAMSLILDPPPSPVEVKARKPYTRTKNATKRLMKYRKGQMRKK